MFMDLGPKWILSLAKKLRPKNIFLRIGSAMLKVANISIFPKEGVDSFPLVKKLKGGKLALAIIKAVVKVLISAIKILLSQLQWLLLAIAIITAVATFIMFYGTIMEELGGFRGTINVDIGHMQELNQDTARYIDLQNTDGLIEAFYQDVSSTSFYQTFNLRDMDGTTIDPFTRFLTQLSNKVLGTNLTDEDIYAQRKKIGDQRIYSENSWLSFGGIIGALQYDPRYIITDANKNPIKYLKQAEVIGTDETGTKLNAYFRDYYNKEATFTLSPTFLYEMNQWAYGLPQGKDNIVYPEAFTKPIHFVNDFHRIQTDETASDYGEDYVYVTQRITLDDINEPTSPYYKDYEHEGLIKSTPSDIVWDYAITDRNTHQISYNTESVGTVNIGNVSGYASERLNIFYDDNLGNYHIEKTGINGGLGIIEGVVGGKIYTAKAGDVIGLGDSLMQGVVTASGNTLVNSSKVGAATNEIANNLATRISGAKAVLISAGTNDIAGDVVSSKFSVSYSNLLNTVSTLNPGATIVVSSIPKMGIEKSDGTFVAGKISNTTVEEANTIIKTLVQTAEADKLNGCTFVYVDMYAAMDKDLQPYRGQNGTETIHFVSGGYKLMYNALMSYVPDDALIKEPTVTPDSTQTPAPTASPEPSVSPEPSPEPTEKATTQKEEAETLKDTTAGLVKLYWKVNPDCVEKQLGTAVNEETSCSTDEASTTACYIGPYLTMTVDDAGIHLDDLIEDSISYAGNEITQEMNVCPRKHVQTAPIFNADGEMLTSSRNLFNKIYVRQAAVKESFRNADEYWSKFQDFLEQDMARGTSFNSDNGLPAPCSAEKVNEERALPWESRTCSITRVYMKDGMLPSVIATIADIGASIAGDVSMAELDITPTAMYQILLDYEDYLVSTGTQGHEWEYRYFATSNEDKLKGVAQFKTINVGLFNIPDFLGVKNALANDKVRYEDTFDAIVEVNEDRSVATEYTPVAVITGNKQLDDAKDYTGANNLGWGWKYDVENDEIRMVLGEASMEFPTYTINLSDTASEITNAFANGGKDLYTGLSTAARQLTTLFLTSAYGEINYGQGNFTNYWDNGHLNSGDSWDKIRAALRAGGIISNSNNAYSYINADDGSLAIDNIADVRNDDYVWNPDTPVWRPVVDDALADLPTGKMVACDATIGQCGRITTKNSDTDYLPMELKSVRDYGLGSVLSYIEGRRVVFKTGVSATEYYDSEAVANYFDAINSLMEDFSFPTSSATKGFYPIQLIDENLFVQVNDADVNLMESYRGRPDGLKRVEDLTTIAHAFESAQGSGGTSVTIDGLGVCTLNGEMNGTQYKILCDNGSGPKFTGLYAFIPHITDSTLNQGIQTLLKGKNINTPNQYWNPEEYYLAWFDYSSNYDEDDIWSKVAHLVQGGFTSSLDTPVAQKLRTLQGNDSHDFSRVSNDDSWLAWTGIDAFTYWTGAGTYVSEVNKQAFFNKYGGDINPIDLIDRSQTQRLYLVEEAATFLGEFTYTYKDQMQTIGNLNQENAIISDLAWGDRYYFLSNFIFAQAIKEYKTDISTGTITSSSSPSDESTGQDEIDKHNAGMNAKNWQDFEYWLSSGTNYGGAYGCYTVGEGEDAVTYCCYNYVRYKNYINYKGQKTLKVDAPSEVQQIINKLNANGYSDVAQKIIINLKVYADLGEVNFFNTSPNVADLNKAAYHDYSQDSGVGTGDTSLPASAGDNDNHYVAYGSGYKGYTLGEKWSSLKTELSARSGLKALTSGMVINGFGLVDDENYKVDFDLADIKADKSNTSKYVSTVPELTDDDMKKIVEAIVQVYGNDSKWRPRTESTASRNGVNYPIITGIELDDDWEKVSVGVNMADRADQGVPIPLYEFIAGAIKEIMPLETGSFFNGEDLNSYKSRIQFKDSDGLPRYNYLINLREDRTQYLYDYLQNFEAYVPLDAKVDGDLEVRGYDSLISIRINYNSTATETTGYTSVISSSFTGEIWNTILAKFKESNIDETTLAQVLTGLVEVSIKNAPERTILLYNNDPASTVKLENSEENKAIIYEVIHKGLALNGNMPLNIDDYRIAKGLKVEGANERIDVYVPILGYAGIESMPPSLVAEEAQKAPNATINSDDYGSSSGKNPGTVILTINENTDDRFDQSKSILFASSKFARYLDMYGNIPNAVVAYLYGETFFDALISVTRRDSQTALAGLTDNDVKAALEAIKTASGGSPIPVDVDSALYNIELMKDVLSYIPDAEKRNNAIQSQAKLGIVNWSDFGKYSATSDAIYKKWHNLIDPIAEKYGTDRAIIAMIWAAESHGNACAGISTSDNIESAFPNGEYDPALLGQLRCAGSSWLTKGYNGGGGLGQIHDTSGSNTGVGGGRGFSRSGFLYPDGTPIVLTMHNPREEGMSNGWNISASINPSQYNIQEYMKADTRFNPETGAYASIAYIQSLLDANPDDVVAAVVSYNTGGVGSIKNKAIAAGYGDDWYTYYHDVWVPGAKGATQYWEATSKYYSKDLSDGTLVLSSGGSGKVTANLNTYKDTQAYNTYQRDKVALQNSGIEAVGREGLQRSDVDMILTSALKSTDVNVRAYEYDLFDFFNVLENEAGANSLSATSTWTASSKLAELGTGRNPAELSASSSPNFRGLPPLFRINPPLGENATYRITSRFGPRNCSGCSKNHQGIDIGFPAGEPIYPIASGVVLNAEYNSARGYYVLIDHGDPTALMGGSNIVTNNEGRMFRITGVQSYYEHMVAGSLNHLKTGTKVIVDETNMDQIGAVNNSGASKGNHLHLNIRIKSDEIDASGNIIKTFDWEMVDPLPWLTSTWYKTDADGNIEIDADGNEVVIPPVKWTANW